MLALNTLSVSVSLSPLILIPPLLVFPGKQPTTSTQMNVRDHQQVVRYAALHSKSRLTHGDKVIIPPLLVLPGEQLTIST